MHAFVLEQIGVVPPQAPTSPAVQATHVPVGMSHAGVPSLQSAALAHAPVSASISVSSLA
jgi:hypothetical protein